MGTTVDQVGKSFLDFGFVGLKDFLVSVTENTPTNVTSLIATTYFEDNTVVLTMPSNSPGLTAFVTKKPGGILHFDITNVKVLINQACNAPLAVKTDIWGSNSNAGAPKAQCYICALPSYFNDPQILGIVPCFNPRRVNFALASVQTNTSFYYRIYQDDGDDNFEPSTDDIDVTVGVNPTITTDGSGNVALAQYSVVQPPAGSTLKNYWIQVIKVGTASGVATLLKPLPGTECAPLPVDFKSFTATRNRSSVLLRWETSSEINNSGFAVERNMNGTWEQIAFVNSQAVNGNSDALLTYTYSDMNTAKGITQYRIKQVDFDNKSKYTEIRSVRGLDQIGKVTVYPNPTSNGTVNVVFDDASVARTISVMDMSGRTLKQINNVTNNNITIDYLQPGMYTLRILVPETGEQTVQKIVVNKR